MNPFIEVFIRSVGAFFVVLIITRIIGKTQIAQLNVTDFVNAIVLGSIAGVMATNTAENAWYYAFGLLVFGSLTFGTEYLSLKYRPARKLLEGEPTVVIHNGKVLENNMRKMTYNMDDLTMQLRGKNIFNISDVEFAVLETNGDLSVLPKSPKQPVTLEDMNLPGKYQTIASELIVDGEVIRQNLIQNNLSEEWLYQQLENQNIKDIGSVLFASLDSQGNLYVDLKKDNLQSPRDITD
ncbi:MAG: YetF domain-containing protein [Bacillota bacterium]